MTDPPLRRWLLEPRTSPAALRASLGVLCLVAFAAAISACGASGASAALGGDVLAPLSVLPDTDVALETNLQTALQGGAVEAGTGISGISSSGVPEVSGPPTSAGVVSVANTASVSVYTAFNPLDQHCLGTLVLKPGSPTTLLGESVPGSYDFWFGHTTASACSASIFTSESTVPSGWATGDPSATGWPSA